VIWLHRYARVLAAATLLLVAAGGMVTSTNSGLSVPDWPTTYGRQMFSFPLSQMVGGIFYEHGHRLIASLVGLLTVGLALWLWRVETRPWVRRLGWLAVAAVVAQGVLGGLTVIYLLPDAISISHAGLAQIFFSLTVSLALFTSPTWRNPPAAPVSDPGLRRLLLVTTLLVYGQILLGATMRHTGAGLPAGLRAAGATVLEHRHRAALRAPDRRGDRDDPRRGSHRPHRAPAWRQVGAGEAGLGAGRGGRGTSDARRLRRAHGQAASRQHAARRDGRHGPCHLPSAHPPDVSRALRRGDARPCGRAASNRRGLGGAQACQ
jgi:hypothetical protein